MSIQTFPLFELPVELRLQIYDLLLAPTNADGLTVISRACSALYAGEGDVHPTARAHTWADARCHCNLRPFYLLDTPGSLSPQLLRSNNRVYKEALPSLYQRRTFVADGNREYASHKDRMQDCWYLLDMFLKSLPEESRYNIRYARLPLLLGRYDNRTCRQALVSIARSMPWPDRLEIAVGPRFVSEKTRWIMANVHGYSLEFRLDDLNPEHDESRDGTDDGIFGSYRVGPIMAICNLRPRITAINLCGLEPWSFSRVKTLIECKAVSQITSLHAKHARRVIQRFKALQLDVLDEGGILFERGCGIELEAP